MRIPLVVAGSVVLSLTGAPLVAQEPGGGLPPSGLHSLHRREGYQRPQSGAVADPVTWDGPPTPAAMTQIAELTDEQRPRYDSLYSRFMAATAPERDTAAAARKSLREALGSRDVDAIRERSSRLKSLAEDLAREQKEFDGSLKEFLTKDQLKEYQQWREQQRQWARDQQAQEGEGRQGERRSP